MIVLSHRNSEWYKFVSKIRSPKLISSRADEYVIYSIFLAWRNRRMCILCLKTRRRCVIISTRIQITLKPNKLCYDIH